MLDDSDTDSDSDSDIDGSDYIVLLRAKYCLQAESAAMSDEHYSMGDGTDRTGDQSFDDIFNFLTLP